MSTAMGIKDPSDSQRELRRVALIAGPTASGKTALALRVARRIPTTIINADSAQVYRDLPILSAQPSPAEQAEVPHRLFGHIDAAEPCNAARWAAEAKAEIEQAWSAGHLPLLVGGTGLYLRALLDGIAPVPPVDPEVRSAVRAMSPANAHAALSRDDPAAASRLAPADRSRVMRALEVIRSTGRGIGDWQADTRGGIAGTIALCPLLLLPDREVLAAACEARLRAMFAAGAVEEARQLIARGLDPALPAMKAIGVPQIAALLAGTVTAAQAFDAALLATRQYAKRQATWFRNQSPPDWPRRTGTENISADALWAR